jgi:hypothetical protein
MGNGRASTKASVVALLIGPGSGNSCRFVSRKRAMKRSSQALLPLFSVLYPACSDFRGKKDFRNEVQKRFEKNDECS